MDEIRREMEAKVVKSGDRHVSTPVVIEFVYMPEEDPLAVMMIAHQETEADAVWIFGRELVAAGVKAYVVHVGDGDVRFRNAGRGELIMCLRSDSGHADIQLPTDDVEAFLADTFQAIPLGDEHFEELMDEALKEWLDG